MEQAPMQCPFRVHMGNPAGTQEPGVHPIHHAYLPPCLIQLSSVLGARVWLPYRQGRLCGKLVGFQGWVLHSKLFLRPN